MQVKANSARRRAARAWLAVEASNASDDAPGALRNKHGRRVIPTGAEAEATPHIPVFPLRDLEDPRLVAYVAHDRSNSNTKYLSRSCVGFIPHKDLRSRNL